MLPHAILIYVIFFLLYILKKKKKGLAKSRVALVELQ